MRSRSSSLRRPVSADRRRGSALANWRWAHASMSLERDPLRRDGELPDLGLVQAGSGLEHGQGASHLRLVAQVLQHHDVVGHVGDTHLRQPDELEQLWQLVGHQQADPEPGAALHQGEYRYSR